MAAGNIPTPLPKWSKWAIALGATPNSYLVQFLDYLGSMKDSSDPSPGEWRHFQLTFKDTVSGLAADEMVVTFDIANITNGGIDSSWTDQDYATVISALQNSLSNIMALVDPGVSTDAIKAYRRAYNPYSDPKPFTIGGPPEKVFPWALPGSATSGIPHQNACTWSEITTFPKHWGRAYWPACGYAAGHFGAGGRLSNGTVDAVAQSIHSLYDTLQGAEFFPVVPTTQVNKAPSRQLLGVTAVQVDNIGDVIRRRRARSATYRNVLPVP